ncbi:MAG TPA: hypothetical protein PLV52_04945, partial [Candidatus Omnitrophota bacterium]|nr:hypothetical protein [Candidatus Omnitrophota bacterium]
NADYTLTDPSDEEELPETPQNMNEYQYQNNELAQINKYDLTRMDIAQLLAGATQKTDENGVHYWVSYKDAAAPDGSRLIDKIIYGGSGDDKKIQYILTGYRLINGEYQAKYRVEYQYNGADLASTKKYDISSGTNVLVEESVYTGTGDANRISQTYFYSDKTGALIARQDYAYDAGGILEYVSYYDTTSLGAGADRKEAGTGLLLSRTFFVGEKKKEVADYSLEFNKDGDISTTTVYYYHHNGGTTERAAGADNRDPKNRSETYWGEVDADGDGQITASELAAANKKSETWYDYYNRLPGGEVADRTKNYMRDGVTVTDTTIYYYIGTDGTLHRAGDANYREALAKSETYWGDADTNNDGQLDAGAARRYETTFATAGRLKGEEIADFTKTYMRDGTTVVETTVYIYEGGTRAETADDLSRKERTVSYWGNADTNNDGKVSAAEAAAAAKRSETYFQFSGSTKAGQEVADITFSYTRDGSAIRETTVYFYDGDKRAAQSTYLDGLERTATYWGGDVLQQISLLDSEGQYDTQRIAELINIKFGIDISAMTDGAAIKDAFLDYISGGSASMKSSLIALLALDPADLANKERLVSALMNLGGNNIDLLEVILSIDISTVKSKEDLIVKVLKAFGLAEEPALLIAMILSVRVTDSTTKDEYIDNLLAMISSASLITQFSILLSMTTELSGETTGAGAKAALLAKLVAQGRGGSKLWNAI